jgi:hypothetical protein
VKRLVVFFHGCSTLSLTNIYPGFSTGNKVHQCYSGVWTLSGLRMRFVCTKQTRWMDKSKVVPDYKLEHTNKESDGRLTSLLLLARFFSSACFVTACTFQTFSSTPLLALLLLPLDVFDLSYFRTPLLHMPP